MLNATIRRHKGIEIDGNVSSGQLLPSLIKKGLIIPEAKTSVTFTRIVISIVHDWEGQERGSYLLEVTKKLHTPSFCWLSRHRSVARTNAV
jgi:hypothetical protein